MSELRTDALHMTSPLRVGRRVGRTIYAQLGPEPSDVDPLVATADSPVLAERIVRAVNGADPVAREDTASPDEDGRTVACPDCGGVVGVLDSIPSLSPVIDDHKWLGVLCSGSGTALDRPVPAQPTEASDVQRAAPTRDVLVECGRNNNGSCSASHEHVDHRVGHPASDERARDPEAHERAVMAFFSAYAITERSVGGSDRTDTLWRKPNRSEAERMADVALGVLRGGGADGGGEDKRVARQKKVIKLLQRMQDGHFRMARDEIIPSIEDALFGTDDGEMLNDEDATVPVGEFRRLLREEWAPAAGPAERQWAVTQFEEHDAAIARLARAAGVPPDSEDPVGAIEAAIRARRELPEPGGTDANAGTWWEVGPLMDDIDDETWTVQARDGGVFLDGNLIPARDLALALLAAVDRAAAPTPAPLTVGDEVKTPEQLAALPEHTVLRDASFDVCERMHDRWRCFTGTDHIDLPARILDLPGGDAS